MRSNRTEGFNTLVAKASREVTGFREMYKKLYQKVKLSELSESTLTNYGRAIAHISLYFHDLPLNLSTSQIDDYLLVLKEENTHSPSYFKHTVYGLRYLFRLYGRDDRAVQLPALKKSHKLPVVLSKAECKRLFAAPDSLKYRVFLSLVYSAGLRLQEVSLLKITDIDSDRMQIHIRQSKGKRDRYVVLAHYALEGLRKYYKAYRPEIYLFNGQKKGEPLAQRSIQHILREAVKKSGIQKRVTLHTLRHSYATHLLEDGVDLPTIQQQLGHVNIQSTMLYIHIAQVRPSSHHSPLDTLYDKVSKT